MATIHSLAPEILADIFELAHDPHTPSTMCAASLVCRAWRDPAQRALFQDVVLAWPESFGLVREDSESPTVPVSPKNWKTYWAVHPPTPRQAEMRGLSSPTVAAGAQVLRCLSGTKSLIVEDCSVHTSFLIDENLREIEHLQLRTITDLSITLYVPNAAGDLPRAFATVQNLHHLTLRFDPAGVPRALNPPSSLFQSLAGSLPTSIKRLSIANVRGATDRTHLALSEVSLPEIQELFSHNRLPELARLDFADCKRKDLEDEAAAADLLAECDRRSIRVVCWEELL